MYTEQVSAILSGPQKKKSRASSIEKKLTVHKFYKQSTKRRMQSQDSPPPVVAPLVQQHQPAVVQPQPKQRATVKIEAWCLVCVRGSAERVLPQWDRSTDVWQSTTVGLIYSNPERLARQKSDDTRGPDPNPSPSAWTCARDASAYENVDDTETAALIGGGQAFGKMHAACP